MRKLLAGVSIMALTIYFSGNARAQVEVDAPVLNLQGIAQLANWGTQLENWTKELSAWGQQYQQMATQIQQMTSIYNSLSHVTDLGSAVGALGVLGINNPLPVNPWAVQSLLSGNNAGLSGIGASISGLANRSWGANHYYTPTDGSLASQLLVERANGQAGYQGIAGGLYESIAQRMPLLKDLHDRLLTSADVKETADLAGPLCDREQLRPGADGTVQCRESDG